MTSTKTAVQETAPESEPAPQATCDEAAAPASETASTPRRMPDDVRKHLLRLRDGKLYLPAAFRVVWFRNEHPDWSIVTDTVEGGFEAGWTTVKATILTADGRIVSTGMKTESKADFPAGWVEKAETGAIGRALAMAGYGTQFAPDLDEAVEGASTTRYPGPRRATPSGPVWHGPGLCPRCHAPAGKPHARGCSD